MVQLLGRVCRGDYRGTRLRQALYNRAVLRKGKRTDRPEDRGRFALARDLHSDPFFGSGNDNSAAVDTVRNIHATSARFDHRLKARRKRRCVICLVVTYGAVVFRVE